MKKRFSLGFIAFFQSLGLFLYCSLVAVIFWKGNSWFGRVPNYIGPLLFLTLFTTSALVCGFLVLGYPFLLIWERKKPIEAMKLIGFTVLWSMLFVLSILFLISRIF
ncbi:hypothetical protein A2W14_07505 [Candidatus Gottesmanbacteria bacterium RBG_16_37_8]|uniref:Uncharacterized protein n=1 Tax=Candidatus Gottesmanbacteria bacterium RBG_16_37_8 TaxID=1798371 RepID=A0A1F5YTG1_9BACT|nr:MAG: hypothetical protein A2W14_07505 [Candidatus Gottesmanbacteria bacterium RBG_16_37_8]